MYTRGVAHGQPPWQRPRRWVSLWGAAYWAKIAAHQVHTAETAYISYLLPNMLNRLLSYGKWSADASTTIFLSCTCTGLCYSGLSLTLAL